MLCIAHRVRTIISWDRVLVMEAGNVAVGLAHNKKRIAYALKEFGQPLELFDAHKDFHSMCERSGITRDELVRARCLR